MLSDIEELDEAGEPDHLDQISDEQSENKIQKQWNQKNFQKSLNFEIQENRSKIKQFSRCHHGAHHTIFIFLSFFLESVQKF